MFERLRVHFADSMPPQCTGDVWCSTEDGTPLKWHRPSGVLFDLHGTPDELPWRLVVHFTKFPQADVRLFVPLPWSTCALTVLVRCCLLRNSCSVRARSEMSSGTL